MKWTSVILILLGCGVSGCSSSGSSGGYMMPDLDGGNMARGEAYTADGMHFRKEMPDRRGAKPWQFYYKHCAMNGDKSYYSKTSYDCNGPYY